jgi:hypothetical protein
MHATIGRYEGFDTNRTEELTRKVGESLVPELRKLAGFSGYYLIETDSGILSSVGLFEHPTQADEATKLAASWVKTQGLESALPNEPKITAGKVVAKGNGGAVA